MNRSRYTPPVSCSGTATGIRTPAGFPLELAKGIPLYARSGAIRAFAMVDAEDHERLGSLRWHLRGGTPDYVARRVAQGGGRVRIYLHRAVLGLSRDDPRRVDHMNGDTLDNRRSNLRIATDAENAQNQGSRGGSSRFRGVSWDKSKGRWYAQAQLAGRKVNLGRHRTEEEAAAAVARWRADHMPFSQEALARADRGRAAA